MPFRACAPDLRSSRRAVPWPWSQREARWASRRSGLQSGRVLGHQLRDARQQAVWHMQDHRCWGYRGGAAVAARQAGAARPCTPSVGRYRSLILWSAWWGSYSPRRCQNRKPTQVRWLASRRPAVDTLGGVTWAWCAGPVTCACSSPMGLKRINFDELPDQFVDMEGEAAPVAEDNDTVALFRPLLSRTQLESKPLRLAYDAERDGWSPAAFHRGVDSFGAAVVLAVTEGGAIIGGYNPEGGAGCPHACWVGVGTVQAQAHGLTQMRPLPCPPLPLATTAMAHGMCRVCVHVWVGVE